MRRLLIGLLGATLVLGACGGDDDDGSAAVTSIPDETTTSSTTTTEPPVPPVDVIPQDVSLITEEYVENVLDALYEVSLEAIELARAEGVVDQPSIQRVEAINSEATATEAINSLLNASAGGFDGFQQDPEPVRANVQEVIDRTPICVLVDVRFDTSGLVRDAQPLPDGVRTFAMLVPATEEQRASGLNPTAWTLDQLPVTEDGSVPAERCA